MTQILFDLIEGEGRDSCGRQWCVFSESEDIHELSDLALREADSAVNASPSLGLTRVDAQAVFYLTPNAKRTTRVSISVFGAVLEPKRRKRT